MFALLNTSDTILIKAIERTNGNSSWEYLLLKTSSSDYMQMLTLVRTAYAFGFFKRDEEFLLPRFKEILDVQMDSGKYWRTLILISRWEDVLETNSQWRRRNSFTCISFYFICNSQNVKLEVCKIIELYLDLKLKYTFEEFITAAMDKFQDKVQQEEMLKEHMLIELESQVLYFWFCLIVDAKPRRKEWSLGFQFQYDGSY